jgi:hypothetical protein
MRHVEPFLHLGWMVATLWVDLVRFLGASLRSRTALSAENLCLRKQLALYRERQGTPRRASDPMRFARVLLARCCAWREALPSVQSATPGPLAPAGVPAPLVRATLHHDHADHSIGSWCDRSSADSIMNTAWNSWQRDRAEVFAEASPTLTSPAPTFTAIAIPSPVFSGVPWKAQPSTPGPSRNACRMALLYSYPPW